MADMKFTQTHEWIQVDGEEALIGITDHAQQLLGDLVFVELPKEGEEVNAGDELGVVESVKAASDFYAPASGTVLEINQAVIDDPALVNTDPLGAGWLVKLQLNEMSDVTDLLDAEQYATEIAEDE